MSLNSVLLRRRYQFALCTVARQIMAGGSKRAASTSKQPAAKKGKAADTAVKGSSQPAAKKSKAADTAVKGSSQPAAKKSKAADTAVKGSSQPAAKKNKTETEWHELDFNSDAKGKNGHS